MTTKDTANIGEHQTVPLLDLNHYSKNPRRGDVQAIKGSIVANGIFRPVIVNKGTYTDKPNEILAGNHTVKAIRELAEENPDDRRWQQVEVWMVDVDAERAARIVLADNRTADLGSYDNEELLGLLNMMDGDLDGTGYEYEDLDSLTHLNEVEENSTEIGQQYEEGDNLPDKLRETPIDLIFSTIAACTASALAAYDLGWNPGIITSSVGSARSYVSRFPRGKPIMFMDNEWHDYDHRKHVDAVAEFKPKYATTRDIMTRQQCDDAGVEFLTIEEILDQAAEIANHADNVILIPKFDCLDRLPREINGKRVVLGYSVHSSYGGTELPAERLKGWPVHLLGGSWKKQRALLKILGDDVVSLDNNNFLKTAQFGQYNTVGGGTGTFRETFNLGEPEYKTRFLTPNVAISAALIIHDINTNFYRSNPIEEEDWASNDEENGGIEIVEH